MPWRLLSIEAKNFLSYKEMSLDIRKPGLYILSGKNEKGGDSNGSGKSSILSAISFALFGRTPKGVAGREVVRWGSGGGMTVTLSLIDGEGNMMSVSRGLEKLEVNLNDETLKGSKPDLQKQINEILKSNYFLFINSACFSQGEGEFLCEAGDVDKKRLLKEISGLEAIDKMYASVKSKLDKNMSMADTLKLDIERASSYLVDLDKRLEGYKHEHESFSTAQSARCSSIAHRISVGPKPEAVKPIEERVNALRNDLEIANSSVKNRDRVQLENSLKEAYKSHTEKTIRMDGIRTTLSELDNMGGTCTICGNVMSRKAVGDRRSTLLSEMERLQSEEHTELRNISDRENDIRVLDSLERRVSDLSQRLNQEEILLSQTIEKNKMASTVIEDLKRQLEYEQNVPNPFENFIASTIVQRREAEHTLESKGDLFRSTTRDIDSLAYLKWVLSREGAASFIIEQTFGRLEQLANFYLGSISQEGFKVQIKPQRELKGGGVKEEIDIKVVSSQGLIPFANLSDGQRQRVNIALLIATYQLCQDLGMNKFDFLLLDEVLDLSLDQKGQEDMVVFIRNLLVSIHHVFVVSHKPDISQNFDYEISVQRDQDGLSRIEHYSNG